MKRDVLVGLLWFIVQFLVQGSTGERILITSMGFSHIYGLAAIGRELEKKGHEVMYLAPWREEESTLRAVGEGNSLKVIFHGKRSPIDDFKGSLVNFTLWDYFMRDGKYCDRMNEDYCDVLKDEAVMSLLNEYNPDFCLVDYVFLTVGPLMIPYTLGLRYGVRIQAISKWEVDSILPSWIAHAFADHDDEMNFLQRLHSTIYYMFWIGFTRYVSPKQWSTCSNISYPGYAQFQANAAVVLADSDLSLQYAIPLPPKVVLVGGAQIKTPKPLPQEFEKYFQHSESIILFAMGSEHKNYPKNVISAVTFLMDKLDNYNLLMVLDMLDGASVSHPRITTVTHAPQHDILSHPKLKLFISHCGAGSQMEAVYNAKPILCIPIARDQFHNGGRIRQRGMGLTLSGLWDVTGHELLKAATEILNEPSYLKTAQKLSAIFHEQPLKPAERGAHWVDHVVRHGSRHLRFAGDDLWWWQYYLLDVWFAMVTGLVVWLCTLYYCCRCGCLMRKSTLKTTKQD